MQNTSMEKKKNRAAKPPVQIIIKREFVGEKSLADAITPIIYDDIRKKLEETDTFDIPPFCA